MASHALRLFTRRRALGLAFGLGVSSAIPSIVRAACEPTPEQTAGPFYPTAIEHDDWDLTRLPDSDRRAEGTVIDVAGQVADGDCRPLANAVVEIWQANASGRYDHPRDEDGPRVDGVGLRRIDPAFQGHAQLIADADGRYRFRTIRPGPYPVFGGWVRPPHIHFRVIGGDGREMTTQMYFAGEPLNDRDRLLGGLPEPQRRLVTVTLDDWSADGIPRGTFDIALT